MSRRRRIDIQEEDTELNMTPMLDVVFILLIFFIVTTVFVKQPGIDPEKPFASEDKPWSPTILVGVNDIDEVWIADQPYEVEEIRTVLQTMKDETPEATAIIQADAESSAGVVGDIQLIMQDLDIQTRVSTK